MMQVKQNDSIGYKGSVTIRTYDTITHKTKTYKTHNAGKIGLFTFLVQALQGITDNTTRPSKIDLYQIVSGQDESVLSYPIVYTTTPEIGRDSGYTDGFNKITYLFTVPGAAFNVQSGTIKKIKLFNNANNINYNECAEIELPSASEIPFTNTTNIIVQWTLTFVSTI